MIQILDPEIKPEVSEKMGRDIKDFMEAVALEQPDLKSLKINQKTFTELFELLKEFYHIG